MSRIRIGIIGIGKMGLSHADYLLNGEVNNAELKAVCARSQNTIEKAESQLGDKVSYYKSADELLNNSEIDAVIITTPHETHPSITIKAFEKGKHVLLEKPSGVFTKQVKPMNEAAVNSGLVFGMVYQHRTNPVFVKVKELIENGDIGEIRRTSWIITTNYRSQSYYDMDDWRGTWKGEGGGVLLNQAIHQLDIFQWICGMPKKIQAYCSFGKYHDIDVEDEVNAYFEYSGGAVGHFTASSAEAAGVNRLEIAGNCGRIVVNDGKEIEYFRLKVPEREFNKNYKGGFGEPEKYKVDIDIKWSEVKHKNITQSWIDEIISGKPQITPGIEGINSLELANAMILSEWLGRKISLPIDDDLYFSELEKRRK